MSEQTIAAIVRWQNALGDKDPLEITFHGGEPLVPGASFYAMALPMLRDDLARHKVKFSVQSNLWLLTDELCELFREYDVSIGTSLDGPEAINDAQRGKGYFARTLAGIARARTHGLNPGCICTFTAQSASRANEVFDFFVREGLNFSIHAALAPLGMQGDGWAMSPEAHGTLLIEMLDRYLANLDKVRISTLNAMCRSVSAGRGGICTFGDCLGEYLAIDPEGRIYSCQRFAGMPEYRLGNVRDCPSRDVLADASAWKMFAARQEHIKDECGDCAYFDFCRGGCPYNALADTPPPQPSPVHRGGSIGRDPHCEAYKRVFQNITDRALEQVFSEENLSAVVADGASKHGLLRKGNLLQIMRGSPHPRDVAPQARKAIAAVALAVAPSPEQAAQLLDRAGIVTDLTRATQSITALQNQLRRQSQGLVNCYLHVTYACNLQCNHCYASSDPHRTETMPVENVAQFVRDAARAGFGKAVITGGKPMAHPQRHALLDALAALRPTIKPMQIILRTNLAYPLMGEHKASPLLERLAHSVDQIVVSVDGDEASHDARRRSGTYARAVANLHKISEVLKTSEICTLSLTAVLTAAQIIGADGNAVRALGEELGIGVRFKPVLPIGRAATQSLAPEFYSSLDEDISEIVAHRLRVASTCGLGMNLYIAPDGECFPCYALMSARHTLGNARADGLDAVLGAERFQSFKHVTVDSDAQCRECALRNLCGGFCRAWSRDYDPDASPTDCNALHQRARELLVSALEMLNVNVEQWRAAGLPIPDVPPTML